MADRRLLIAKTLIEQMRRAAVEALPNECCGLLVGRRAPVAVVTRVVPAANVHDDPARFFTVDPAAQFKLLRDLGDERLLGVYHSHPEGPPAPSPRDLAEANDPDLIWLVIHGRTGDIGAFQPVAGEAGKIGRFEPMVLIAG